MTHISHRASPIIEFASSPPVFRGHDMLLSQYSQLTAPRIHLDLAAADDHGGYVLVKTDKHGQISKRGTLHKDGIYRVKHECKGHHAPGCHFVEHPCGRHASFRRVQDQYLAHVGLAE